ncbi:MAG: ABC transporter ATP-binding protein [Gammaproteobacteria bacterium]|nr:ABC transporter ATP-binding protein [Gammaproteobacteria bacterium]
MPHAPLLEARHVARAYREGARSRAVLRDVDLVLEAGERVALLGRSGCGKSTLLNLLGAIDAPDAGTVAIDGVDLGALDERSRTLFRRRHVGFVYQSFNLIPTLTAVENVALPLELNGSATAAARRGAAALLDAIGLGLRADAFPDELSGGEQQRVTVARALVHRPRLLLADEPTGNLDVETGARVLALLRELSAGAGHAQLIVTHSLAVARTADRILTLEDGVVRAAGDGLAW